MSAALRANVARLSHRGRGRHSAITSRCHPVKMTVNRRSMAVAAHKIAHRENADVPPVLWTFIGDVLRRYWDRSPTAVTAMELIQTMETPSAPIYFDHLAFRTFGEAGMGIQSIAKIFLDFGYTEKEDLYFTHKHLKATWFSPPHADLPRVFISELQVKKLSPEAQAIIDKYLQRVGNAGEHASMLAATGSLPWGSVDWDDYEALQQESEYASWTLTNAYNLNHTTVSVHRLAGLSGGIKALNEHLEREGLTLNQSGGVLKVSPDGALLQSSTVADVVEAPFANGETRGISGSYLEFAERLVLPEFQHIAVEEILEEHRRDGFEVSNADHIFESTKTTAVTAN